MKSDLIILDTNLWISFLISKNLNFIDKLIDNKTIKLIFSDELIEEFICVAMRPKFKRYFSNTDIEDTLRIFDSYGKIVKVTSDIKVCRDYKDNFLLNLAIDSKADYLVTGDSDLLVLGEVNKTRIITFRGLLDELK